MIAQKIETFVEGHVISLRDTGHAYSRETKETHK